MCCARLAENAGPKNREKIAIWAPSRNCRAISLQLRYTSINRKNLLNSNNSPTRPRNMVNFGSAAAEIGSLVWGTPTNFNGFRVLAALMHGTPAVGVSQTFRR